jgi:hypothetical protein
MYITIATWCVVSKQTESVMNWFTFELEPTVSE